MADERNPAERVRKLVQFAGDVPVDNSIAPKKYFRSGIEMEKMVSNSSSVCFIPSVSTEYFLSPSNSFTAVASARISCGLSKLVNFRILVLENDMLISFLLMKKPLFFLV